MKNLTKAEEKKLLEIARKYINAIDERGDLEARDNDSEDFIETAVWSLKAALEAAYELGKGERA